MRLCVTGGRAFPDRQFVDDTLDGLHREHVITELAAGCAGKRAPLTGRLLGVDLQALTWAEDRGVIKWRYNADWKTLGRGAGPERNRRMLDQFKPDLVVAFPGGAGTADCIRAARDRSIEILTVEPDDER